MISFIKKYFLLILIITALIPSRSCAQRTGYVSGSYFVVIDDIIVKGNHFIKSGKIADQLTLRKNHWYNLISKKERITDRVIQYQQGLVDSLYHVNGFLDAYSQITTKNQKEPNHVILHVDIFEGEQTRFGEISIQGSNIELRNRTWDRIKKLKAGQKYNHMLVSEAAYRVRQLYTQNGYAYCDVRASTTLSMDRRIADIIITIDPGKLTYFGNITVKGVDYNRLTVAERELSFRSGDKFNENKILDSHRHLYSSGLFSYVSIAPRYNRETMVPPDIDISLKERNPNYINLRTGAGQDQQRDLTLDASIEYGNRSLFGTGRKARFRVKSSFAVINNFMNEFLVSFTEPWFFFIRMPLEIELTYAPSTQSATQDYKFDRFSSSFTLSREISKDTDLKFTENFESIKIHNIAPEQAVAFREEREIQLRRKFISLFRTDKRDNILVPTKGYLTQLSLEYIGGIQGGDINLVKIKVSYNHYKVFKASNVIAGRLQMNWLKEFGSTEVVPIEDLYFMGGASTIRGYSENDLGPKSTETGNPSGGKFSLLANFELRRSLFWRFGSSVFVDIGNLWKQPEAFQLEDLRLTAGAGIQFFTPIGPIRFDYAFRIIRIDDRPGSRYHLSTLYIF
ncbi:MAG: BamA/TamA family outer membrane protein [candidate division Zixibacteria bacterium]|nr:BamA/TamA family outer membrane protein [candidate division Zixibacteria bacterium]